MKKTKVFAAAAAAVALSTVLGMAGSAEEMVKSYITGEQVPESIGRTRPVALMIENDSEAVQWQRGTASASVMYEAMVEGGITRMMGIFEDYENVSQIMPIRSCRPYYVYYAREFDAFYGHYGQVIYAVPILNLDETNDIAGIPFGEDGQDYRLTDGSSAYIRDHEGVTGIYTNHDLLWNVIQSYDWRTEYHDYYEGHYKFAEDGETITLENGQPATVVLPGFEYNYPRFDYNESDHLYYRSEFGSAQIDNSTGEQLAYTNIIIQECPSTMFDDHYLWTDPVNDDEGGEGWYITNGRAEKITWKKEWTSDQGVQANIVSAQIAFDVRPCDFHITHYFDMDGNEIVLNQGKTFVEIIRNQDAGRIVISDDTSITSAASDAAAANYVATSDYSKDYSVESSSDYYESSNDYYEEEYGDYYDSYYDESYDEYYDESYDEYYDDGSDYGFDIYTEDYYEE